jgi:hypothetical protein
MGRDRTFEVSGVDDLGDVHAFRTNDKERAEEMKRLMADDLEDVQIEEQP